MASAPKTALILIDLQVGVIPPSSSNKSRSTPCLETKIHILLAAFRAAAETTTIIHVAHHSTNPLSRLHPSKPEGIEFLPCAKPQADEMVMAKNRSSAFVGSDLAATLKDRGVQRLVICGTTTAHCVSSSVRSAADMNVVEHCYGVSGITNPKPGAIVVVGDACAEYGAVSPVNREWMSGELMHEVALASLKEEFCDVWNTRDVIARMRDEQKR